LFDVFLEFLVDDFLQLLCSGGIGCVFGVIGDNGMVFAGKELGNSIDEVAEIVEEFSVVFCNEFAPEEL
jgi:hypothetical protein